VKRADLQQQRDAQNAAVLNAIAQHGLMAFTEPMSDTEEWNLEYYIRSAHKFTPAELTEAGEYYQNPKIMMALAQNLDSPAKALEILYRHTSEKEKASRSEAVTAQQLYLTIAANPNASPDLLLKMLRSGNSGQRAAALRSGNLPSKQKMEYLEKSCTLTDEPEMLAVAEDPDTPLEVLECLSTKPGAAVGLAAKCSKPVKLHLPKYRTQFLLLIRIPDGGSRACCPVRGKRDALDRCQRSNLLEPLFWTASCLFLSRRHPAKNRVGSWQQTQIE